MADSGMRSLSEVEAFDSVAGLQPPVITLVIPVYHEQDNILQLFDEIDRVVTLAYVALVIYDDDDDGTLIHRHHLSSANPRIKFVRNTGKGVVGAFRTGFDAADTPYIVPIMCDLSDMPETVNRLHAKVIEGYDLVVASRYVRGGRKVGGPRIKLFLSWLANSSLHFLTGIPTHDMTNAFIIYRKEVLDDIFIETTGGFEITMEIIAKAYVLGYRIAEVPTTNRDRAAGKSNFKMLKWMSRYFHWYLYILRYAVVRRLGRPYQSNVRKSGPHAAQAK